jgi:hypothetical protein
MTVQNNHYNRRTDIRQKISKNSAVFSQVFYLHKLTAYRSSPTDSRGITVATS